MIIIFIDDILQHKFVLHFGKLKLKASIIIYFVHFHFNHGRSSSSFFFFNGSKTLANWTLLGLCLKSHSTAILKYIKKQNYFLYSMCIILLYQNHSLMRLFFNSLALAFFLKILLRLLLRQMMKIQAMAPVTSPCCSWRSGCRWGWLPPTTRPDLTP